MIKVTLTRVVFTALVVSLGANLLAVNRYMKKRDELTIARTNIENLLHINRSMSEAAELCSSKVTELEELAKERKKQSVEARRIAVKKADTHNKAADKELVQPPAVPGDDYASAQYRITSWLENRRPRLPNYEE